jgi:hypothetical protein
MPLHANSSRFLYQQALLKRKYTKWFWYGQLKANHFCFDIIMLPLAEMYLSKGRNLKML